MKFEMEILSLSSYSLTSNCLVEESKRARWTSTENKMFENTLVVYDRDTLDRWHQVAAMIPGKTVRDVKKQYEELEADVGQIEAGLVPIPGYSISPFTLEWVNRHGGYDGFKQQAYAIGGKRSLSNRPSDHERKKRVPWTEEEHKDP
ncbi:hypothetical protein ACFX11_020410 [Malus domestica]